MLMSRISEETVLRGPLSLIQKKQKSRIPFLGSAPQNIHKTFRPNMSDKPSTLKTLPVPTMVTHATRASGCLLGSSYSQGTHYRYAGSLSPSFHMLVGTHQQAKALTRTALQPQQSHCLGGFLQQRRTSSMTGLTSLNVLERHCGRQEAKRHQVARHAAPASGV
jgi:hypothetical protein